MASHLKVFPLYQVTRGNPHPELRWHRRERKMPSGEDFLRGASFTYTQVTRHHSGVYVCTADNGFAGEPTSAMIKLDVQRKSQLSCTSIRD